LLAGILAAIWCGAGMAAIVLGAREARWSVVVLGAVACGYGALWIRAAVKGRLITWRRGS
jgi:hypothetical protein